MAQVVDKIRVNRLRWFGHVTMRGNSDAVEVVVEMIIEGKSGWRWPKKIWIGWINNEMNIAGGR